MAKIAKYIQRTNNLFFNLKLNKKKKKIKI